MATLYACFAVSGDNEILEAAEPVLSKLRKFDIRFKLDRRSHQRGADLIIKIHFANEEDLVKALLVCDEMVKCIDS